MLQKGKIAIQDFDDEFEDDEDEGAEKNIQKKQLIKSLLLLRNSPLLKTKL
ncbi:MAG: hypothetical protein QXG00_01605 [Candidatus Woesearchaeota archaeon]